MQQFFCDTVSGGGMESRLAAKYWTYLNYVGSTAKMIYLGWYSQDIHITNCFSSSETQTRTNMSLDQAIREPLSSNSDLLRTERRSILAAYASTDVDIHTENK